MAKEPTTPRTQHGDSEESTAQLGDSNPPTQSTQHQQGTGKKTTLRFTDWASI